MIHIQCFDCTKVYKTWSQDGLNIFCIDCRKKIVEKCKKVFDDIMGCPWCGSHLIIEERVGIPRNNGDPVALTCLDCQARGPIRYTFDKNRSDLLKEAWNERINPMKMQKK